MKNDYNIFQMCSGGKVRKKRNYRKGGGPPGYSGGGGLLSIFDTLAGGIAAGTSLAENELPADQRAGSRFEKEEAINNAIPVFSGFRALAGSMGNLISDKDEVLDQATGKAYETGSPLGKGVSSIIAPVSNAIGHLANKDYGRAALSFIPGVNFLSEMISQKRENEQAEYAKKYYSEGAMKRKANEGIAQRETGIGKQDLYQASLANPIGVATGGQIIGPGGKHDDKIPMNAEQGAFIMTPEGAQKAEQDGAMAAAGAHPNDIAQFPRNKATANAMVSNGEYMLTNEQREQMELQGYDPNNYIDADSPYKVKKGGMPIHDYPPKYQQAGIILPENQNIYEALGTPTLGIPFDRALLPEKGYRRKFGLPGTEPMPGPGTPTQRTIGKQMQKIGLQTPSPAGFSTPTGFSNDLIVDSGINKNAKRSPFQDMLRPPIQSPSAPEPVSPILPPAPTIEGKLPAPPGAKIPGFGDEGPNLRARRQARLADMTTDERLLMKNRKLNRWGMGAQGVARAAEIAFNALREPEKAPEPVLQKPKYVNLDTQGVRAIGQQEITENQGAIVNNLIKQGLGAGAAAVASESTNKAVNKLNAQINQMKNQEVMVNAQIDNSVRSANTQARNRRDALNYQGLLRQNAEKSAMISNSLGEMYNTFQQGLQNEADLNVAQAYGGLGAGGGGYTSFAARMKAAGYEPPSEEEYMRAMLIKGYGNPYGMMGGSYARR